MEDLNHIQENRASHSLLGKVPEHYFNEAS